MARRVPWATGGPGGSTQTRWSWAYLAVTLALLGVLVAVAFIQFRRISEFRKLDGQRIEARGHLMEGESRGGFWMGTFAVDEGPLKGTTLRGTAPLTYDVPVAAGSQVIVRGQVRVARLALLGLQVELTNYELTPLDSGTAATPSASPPPGP